MPAEEFTRRTGCAADALVVTEKGCYMAPLFYCDDECLGAWCNLGGDWGTVYAPAPNLAPSDREKYFATIETIRRNPDNFVAWLTLGMRMPIERSFRVNDKTWNRIDCFSEALRINAECGKPWLNRLKGAAARQLAGPVDYLRVLEQASCVADLRANPNAALSWLLLAISMKVVDVLVVNDTPRTPMACCAEALRVKPTMEEAWKHLCALLIRLPDPAETVLVNGAMLTNRDCHLALLRLNPNHRGAWTSLCATMFPGEMVAVNGTYYTQITCCAEALRIDPLHAEGWGTLGLAMSPLEVAHVNGATYTQRDCLRRGVELNPDSGFAWNGLCQLLADGETVTVNGVVHTKESCAREVSRINWSSEEAS